MNRGRGGVRGWWDAGELSQQWDNKLFMYIYIMIDSIR